LTGLPQPIKLKSVKRFLWVLLVGTVPWSKALPPTDHFEPDLAMYSFADLWVVRPASLAVLPLTATTYIASLPVTAGAGRSAAARSFGILVGEPSKFLMARPLGSFFDWENRTRTRPVVVQFPDSYLLAELSPEQESRYREALKEHQARIIAIEREIELPEADRKALAEAEGRRWENVLRLILSL